MRSREVRREEEGSGEASGKEGTGKKEEEERGRQQQDTAGGKLPRDLQGEMSPEITADTPL